MSTPAPLRPRLLPRRAWLGAALALALPAGASTSPSGGAGGRAADPTPDPVRRGRPIVLPRDHGAHLVSRIEWWYVTGWLQTDPSVSGTGRRSDEAPSPALPAPPADPRALIGFQVTFFRTATGLAAALPGRLAPRHLLFAHAALSFLAEGRHEHDERIARWNGDPRASPQARAALHDADLRLRDWMLRRDDAGPAPQRGRWSTRVTIARHALELQMSRTQPVLLQGEAGWSRKGPQPAQASHYLSEPQLAVRGRLVDPGGRAHAVQGRAWLDHEWSDELLHPEAVGWDWIGINLDDGSALTAFRLRRADGSALWAGGSFRAPGQTEARAFGPDEVDFTPGRVWRSPGSGARYPVEWTVRTPAGLHTLRALLVAQEMLSRGATGTVYWEGLSTLHAADGRRIGLGYLEMTGYAGRLVL